VGSKGVKLRIPLFELLILSLVTVAPISLIGLYSLSVADRSLRTTVGNDFRAMAANRATEIQRFVLERVTEMGRLAADPTLVEAVISANESYQGMDEAAIAARIGQTDRAWNSFPVDPFANELLASRQSVWLRTFQQFDPRLLRITVTDEKGAPIAVTKKPERYSQAEEEYWDKIRNQGQGAVSLTDIRYDEVSKADYIGIGWPVREENTSRFIGALNALVDISAIAAIANRPPAPGDPRRFLLVTEDGTIIAAPEVTFAQRRKSPEFAALEDARGILAPGQTGYIEASFPGGGSQLIGFADTGLKQAYPGFGWVVLVSQDSAEAFGVVNQVGRMLAIMSVIGLVMVTLLLAYFVLHRRWPHTEIGDLVHDKPLSDSSSADEQAEET